jgi:PAS domain S-box-containing protein
LSEKGKVLNVNKKACEMLGYTLDEMPALTIDDIDPNYPSKGFIAFWQDKPATEKCPYFGK